jgi:uncharacterized protein
MPQRPSHTIDYLPITTLASGHRVEIAVHRLVGPKEGPTMVLLGGIHGDEATGVETVRRIIEAIDVDELSGSVVAIPVCNPLAYDAMTRHTLQDGLNLNRIFPGDRKGSVTEQIAAVVAEVVGEADYLLDYHSSGLYSTVDYAFLHEGGEALSEAYSATLLYRQAPYSGSAIGLAVSAGTPAMMSELGGGGQLTREYLDRAVRGTLNVLRTVGILSGDPEKPADHTVMTTLITLRPTKGGALISHYGPETLTTSVPKGTVLGEVINPHSLEVEEELVAPFDPTIIVLTREEYTRVAPGDYGFMVGDGASASPLH